MPRLVFFGNEKLATGVSVNSPIKRILAKKGYEVHEVDKDLSDKKEELNASGADIGILVAYGRILQKSLIDIFPYGIINIHPSLLPKGRGPTPIESAILNGDNKTGVSIMQIAEGMDEGPLLAQESINLTGKETKQELADSLLELGGQLLLKCLDDIFSGTALFLPQDDSKATYTRKITKAQGLIDWDKPAVQLEREIRAYAGWPKSRAKINNIDCIVLEAKVGQEDSNPGKITSDKSSLIVGCKKGSLSITKLQPAGKNPMTAGEFIRGYLK